MRSETNGLAEVIDGFRSPQRNALLTLGAVHGGLTLALVVVTSLFARDDLANWKVVEGQVDPASVAANVPWDAIAVATLAYLPILMLTWFAPQLVAWHRMPVAKAMFYSLFACWRNRWPFLVLALAFTALVLAVPWLATTLMSLLGVSAQLGSMLLAPIGLVLTSVAYSTQYPIYRAVLEAPSVLSPPGGETCAWREESAVPSATTTSTSRNWTRRGLRATVERSAGDAGG